MGLCSSNIVVRTFILRFSFLIFNFPTNFFFQFRYLSVFQRGRSGYPSILHTYLMPRPPFSPLPFLSSFPSCDPPPSPPLRLPSPFCFFSLLFLPSSLPPFFSSLSLFLSLPLLVLSPPLFIFSHSPLPALPLFFSSFFPSAPSSLPLPL